MHCPAYMCWPISSAQTSAILLFERVSPVCKWCVMWRKTVNAASIAGLLLAPQPVPLLTKPCTTNHLLETQNWPTHNSIVNLVNLLWYLLNTTDLHSLGCWTFTTVLFERSWCSCTKTYIGIASLCPVNVSVLTTQYSSLFLFSTFAPLNWSVLTSSLLSTCLLFLPFITKVLE